MVWRICSWSIVLVVFSAVGSLVQAGEAATPESGQVADLLRAAAQVYESSILPLAQRYCFECHRSEDPEGELDLARFSSFAAVRHDTRIWPKVAEMLANGDMPPADSPQPTEAERQTIRRWVAEYLKAEALASAGDPGPVLLRRLSNVEYDNTVQALTGVPLHPSREFPLDGAAGEGFTNTGEALVMSPALFDKYLNAAKEIASHAALLPSGLRFSSQNTPRDWTNTYLDEIRQTYSRYTDAAGVIPWDAYLAATLEHRDKTADDARTLADRAAARGLSGKYLESLWQLLTGEQPTYLVDSIRSHWRAAKPADVPALVAELRAWQAALTRFNSVGYFKPWQDAAVPLRSTQDFRLKFEPTGQPPTLCLAASDAGDGSAGDTVVWQNPRFEMPGCPTLALRDVPELVRLRTRALATTAKYLEAVAAVGDSQAAPDIAALAAAHNVDPSVLRAWLGYLGIASTGPVPISGYLAGTIENSGGYAFVRGWGSAETPSILANSSDQEVRVPGLMKPHSVAVHPSPTVQAVVGWRSPVTAVVRVRAHVADAHPECGNGVSWVVDHRRGSARQRLVAGEINTGGTADAGPTDPISVRPGDVICLLIGPRGDHSCDTTRVDLTIEAEGDEPAKWNLSSEVSGDVLAGNPHADHGGRAEVWHFYTEPIGGADQTVTALAVPSGSLLERWRDAPVADKPQLAADTEKLVTASPPADAAQPDAVLFGHLTSLSGPLFARVDVAPSADATSSEPQTWGIDPALFGKGAEGLTIDPTSLAIQAPRALAMQLPADLVTGREFVVSAALADGPLGEGTTQLQVATAATDPAVALQPQLPIMVREGTAARHRIEAGFATFREWLPAAFCFTQIVPIDEAVTVEEFHRDDEPLWRLLLDEPQQQNLNRLWDELRYVSQDALSIEQSYVQFMEYTTQDRNPADYEPMRKPIGERAAAFRQQLLDSQPSHLDWVVSFASLAYRRPLADAEGRQLRDLYAKLREAELPHEEAIRGVLARVLIAPEFLYRLEQPAPGTEAHPLTSWELASRLSYFLWAGPPDDELRRAAAANELVSTDALVAQTSRMLADSRVRGLATEFACQWIGVRSFEQFDEKSESHFPSFAAARHDMYEETVRFFVELFARNASVLDLLDADYTYLNENLAAHYGIPGVAGSDFRRIDGVRQFGRGGILAFATTLATQSGASRTSPVLRGNWVVEVLLGEKLPKPPKDVPLLPEDEAATAGLTVRELVEKHRSVESCAKCHDRIDPFGFALEAYDAIGRRRDRDLGDRPIDTRVALKDGSRFEGLEGLRQYLLAERREQFLRVFCRKLLGYALGRGTQLSDEPTIDQMLAELGTHEYHFSSAVDTIIRSRQFRFHRGLAEAEATVSAAD